MSLVDALISRATQQKSPISATFELTARCNLSCKMCYIHNISHDRELQEKELSAEQWIAIAEQAAKSGTLILLLTGGEPMLRPDFCLIYRACAERGFLLTVNTNGTLLTDEIFDLLREHPPLRLNVSLYRANENTYASLCGNASAFYRVTENLRKLKQMGIPFRINFAATPYNNHDLQAVHRFAQELGVNVQHTAYMFPPTRTSCQDCFRRFEPEEAASAIIDHIRSEKGEDHFAAFCRAKAAEAPPRLDDCGQVRDGVRCRAGRAAYWVTYEGNMLPCGMIPCIQTSILEVGMERAWQSTCDAFSKVRLPTGCIQCEHYSRCEVCPAICYAEHEDFSVVPDYICRKNAAYRAALSSIAEELEGSICG